MEMAHGAEGRITRLFFRKPAAMNYPAISQVDAYWEALRGERPMPTRAEVDPRGLDHALPYTFILEHVAPGVGRIRVAGMHLNDLLGMEVRGMPLTSFFLPQARVQLSETLQNVVEAPQVAELELEGERGIGRPALPARLFLAPLAHEGRGAPRVLGCLQSHGGIGRAPRRFGVNAVRVRPIFGAEPLTEQLPPAARAPERTPGSVTAGEVPGFAEPVAAFEPAPTPAERPARGKPHLRLVKSD